MRSQVSGSISLDLSGVAGAVLEGLEPFIMELGDQMARLSDLISSAALDEAASTEILLRHLPPHDPYLLSPHEIATALTEALAASGYAIVAVTGPALEEMRAAEVEAPATAEPWADQGPRPGQEG